MLMNISTKFMLVSGCAWSFSLPAPLLCNFEHCIFYSGKRCFFILTIGQFWTLYFIVEKCCNFVLNSYGQFWTLYFCRNIAIYGEETYLTPKYDTLLCLLANMISNDSKMENTVRVVIIQRILKKDISYPIIEYLAAILDFVIWGPKNVKLHAKLDSSHQKISEKRHIV